MSRKTKIKEHANGEVSINVGSSVRSQAKMHNFLNALAGRSQAMTCGKCGGIQDDDTAPTAGKCKCDDQVKEKD